MSETFTTEETEALRRLLAPVSTLPQHIIDPNTWQGKLAAADEAARQKRVADHEAEEARLRAERDRLAEAERVRAAKNAPKIAALNGEIDSLQELRRPLSVRLDKLNGEIDKRREAIKKLQ